MPALSIALTPTTPQNGPSHSAMHNTLNNTNNAITGQYGTDAQTYAAPLYMNVAEGSTGSPITGLQPTAAISRVEHITVPPGGGNVSDPQYVAGLRISVTPQNGNIMQSTALHLSVIGYAENGNYNLGINANIRHTSGHQGGAMALFAGVLSSVNDATTSVIGVGFALNNNTGIDALASGSGFSALDVAVDPTSTNRWGSAMQVRALGPGMDSIFYGFGNINGAGMDFSGLTFANPGEILKLDSTMLIGVTAGTTPIFQMDTNDLFRYNRVANSFDWVIGGNLIFAFDSAGALFFKNLPAVAGGSGTFWHDAGAGNVVKYVP